MSPTTPNGCWVVDRKISLGLIFAVVLHAIALTSWLVKMESRIYALEQADMRHDVAVAEVQKMAVCMEGMRSDISWMRENMSRSHTKENQRGQIREGQER